MVSWSRPRTSLAWTCDGVSMQPSAYPFLCQMVPPSTRKGCALRRWPWPSDCHPPITAASSARGANCSRSGASEPPRPKYPVSAERIPDGQGFKFTSDQVALLLKKGMRDVTPKGQ
jgi:hypothetical protein